MKDIFSPILLLSLLLLTVSHLTGAYLSIVPPFFLITFIAALVFYYLKKYKTAYLFIAFSIALLVTFSFLRYKDELHGTANLNVPQNEYITIEGKLDSYPEIGTEHSVIFLGVELLEYNRERIPVRFSARVKVKGDLRHLDKGDTISINASLYRGNLNRNFYDNPFENYLLYKGIHFSGYCKSAHMISVLKKAHFAWTFIGAWRNKIRGAIERKYKKPGQMMDKKGVFLEAILTGDRGRLETDRKNELLDAGVYHLLAISGAHIGIIALFLLLFLKFLKVPYATRYIATGIFLILFLALSGFKISAQRAVLMALLIFTARTLYLDIYIYNIISFCGLLILFKNPAQFLDPGFILTFTLTAAIVTGRNLFLPFLKKPRFRYIPTYIKELLCANFSASLISLPLSLFFFKRYSFAGFFAGLLLLPLTAVITALGILLIPLAPISQVMAGGLLFIIDFPLLLFFKISAFFSHTLRLTIFRASPHLLLMVFILALFFILPACAAAGKKLRKFLVPAVASLLILSIVFIAGDPLSYKPAHLEVFFLDVGQGDSQVVVFPGGDALLIDGGGTYYSDFETGKQILLPFLLQKRIKIKWVAVSHYHPDHVRGITDILHIIRPEELWLSSQAQEDAYYRSLMERVKDAGIEIRKVDAAFSRKIGECKVECLFPGSFIESRYSHNNHSQVLKVSGGGSAFLFTGDIGREIEEELTGDCCEKLEVDVLKVPHHGSKSSSSRSFLRCAAPGLAIYSYSKNNRFNFPHPRVVENYKAQGTATLTTALRGGIKITALPGKIKIETSK